MLLPLSTILERRSWWTLNPAGKKKEKREKKTYIRWFIHTSHDLCRLTAWPLGSEWVSLDPPIFVVQPSRRLKACNASFFHPQQLFFMLKHELLCLVGKYYEWFHGYKNMTDLQKGFCDRAWYRERQGMVGSWHNQLFLHKCITPWLDVPELNQWIYLPQSNFDFPFAPNRNRNR